MMVIRLAFTILFLLYTATFAWIPQRNQGIVLRRRSLLVTCASTIQYTPILQLNSSATGNDNRSQKLIKYFPGSEAIGVVQSSSGLTNFVPESLIGKSSQEIWKYHLSRKNAEEELNRAILNSEENVQNYFDQYNTFTEVEKAELLQLNDQFFRALDNNDVISLGSLWLDSEDCLCRLAYPKDLISGYKNIMTYFEAMVPAPIPTELFNVHLNFMGDIAIITSQVRYKLSHLKLRKPWLKNRVIEGYVTNIFVKSHASGRFHLLTHLGSVNKPVDKYKSIYRDPTILPPRPRPKRPNGLSRTLSLLGDLNINGEEEDDDDAEDDYDENNDEDDIIKEEEAMSKTDGIDDDDYLEDMLAISLGNRYAHASQYRQQARTKDNENNDVIGSIDNGESTSNNSKGDRGSSGSDRIKRSLERERDRFNRNNILRDGKSTIIPQKNGMIIIKPSNDGTTEKSGNSADGSKQNQDRMRQFLSTYVRDRLTGLNNMLSGAGMIVLNGNGDVSSSNDINTMMGTIRQALDNINNDNGNNKDGNNNNNNSNSSRNPSKRNRRKRMAAKYRTAKRRMNAVGIEDDDDDDYYDSEDDDDDDDEDERDYDEDTDSDDESGENVLDIEETLQRERRLISAASESLITWLENNHYQSSSIASSISNSSSTKAVTTIASSTNKISLTPNEASQLRTDLIATATQGVPSKIETSFALFLCRRKPRYLGGDALLTMSSVPKTPGQFKAILQNHEDDLSDLVRLWKRHVLDIEQNMDTNTLKARETKRRQQLSKLSKAILQGDERDEDDDNDDYDIDEVYGDEYDEESFEDDKVGTIGKKLSLQKSKKSKHEDSEDDFPDIEGLMEVDVDFFADLLRARGLSLEEEQRVMNELEESIAGLKDDGSIDMEEGDVEDGDEESEDDDRLIGTSTLVRRGGKPVKDITKPKLGESVTTEGTKEVKKKTDNDIKESLESRALESLVPNGRKAHDSISNSLTPGSRRSFSQRLLSKQQQKQEPERDTTIAASDTSDSGIKNKNKSSSQERQQTSVKSTQKSKSTTNTPDNALSKSKSKASRSTRDMSESAAAPSPIASSKSTTNKKRPETRNPSSNQPPKKKNTQKKRKGSDDNGEESSNKDK